MPVLTVERRRRRKPGLREHFTRSHRRRRRKGEREQQPKTRQLPGQVGLAISSTEGIRHGNTVHTEPSLGTNICFSDIGRQRQRGHCQLADVLVHHPPRLTSSTSGISVSKPRRRARSRGETSNIRARPCDRAPRGADYAIDARGRSSSEASTPVPGGAREFNATSQRRQSLKSLDAIHRSAFSLS
ncbi:unnamed protein product, partial [Protopolystoma xenopodis]